MTDYPPERYSNLSIFSNLLFVIIFKNLLNKMDFDSENELDDCNFSDQSFVNQIGSR